MTNVLTFLGQLAVRWRQYVSELMPGYLEGGMQKMMNKDISLISRNDLVNHMAFVCDLEWRAAEAARDTAQRFDDRDVRVFSRRQYEEEVLHHKLTKHRLKQYGYDFRSRFKPLPEAKEMFEAYYQFTTPVERFANFNFGQERTAVPNLRSYGQAALALRDYETAKVWLVHILPDEEFHTEYGPLYLLGKYATTPELQARAEAAMLEGLRLNAKLRHEMIRIWQDKGL